MLLKEALEIYKNTEWKIDILETLGIQIKTDYFSEKFYKDRLNQLPKGRYFLSDLDWTFFRWTLIKEAFTVFAKYLRSLDIEKINVEQYKEFLDDFKLFKDLEKLAYNKQIDYSEYLNAGLFLIYKHHKQVDWNDFLAYLKDYFYRHQKVNPFRFSLNKMREILNSDAYFLFISWSSNFVFDIYLELLKQYIWELFGKRKADKIYGFCAYANLEENYVYNLYASNQKFEFISRLKEFDIFEEIIGWMWDTTWDYWISNHLEEWKDFYFINPIYSVVVNHDKNKKDWVKYHFINERKDLIFEYELGKVGVLN